LCQVRSIKLKQRIKQSIIESVGLDSVAYKRGLFVRFMSVYPIQAKVHQAYAQI
jgi:hypothetical protein